MITNDQISQCIDVAIRYGTKRLVLFGSAAVDPQTARDIDLLCYGIDGLRMLSMAAEMENETGAQVDTVSGDDATPFVQYNRQRGRVVYEQS